MMKRTLPTGRVSAIYELENIPPQIRPFANAAHGDP